MTTGQEFLARGAWREAREAFERELQAGPSPEAWEGLGWALYWLDRLEESFDARETAYQLYLKAGDRRSAARVAIGLAPDYSDVRGLAVASGSLERARRLLSDVEECAEHGWLALWDGHLERLMNNDTARARELALRAQQIGRKHGVAELELLAIALEGLAMINEGNLAAGMKRIDESLAAAMAGEMSSLDAVAQTCCVLLFACERVRDYQRAAQWSERVQAFCRRWQIEPLFAVCRTQHAAMLIGRGEWSEAEQELTTAVEMLQKTRPLMLGDAIVQLAELRRRQGRFDEALDLFRRIESRSESLLGRAQIALDRGDADAAADLAQRILRRAMGEKWVERAIALEVVVSANGSPDAAAELRAIADRIGSDILHGHAAFAEGILAQRDGDAHQARAAFEDAVDRFDRAGAPFERAKARVELSRALAASGLPSRAAEELQGAIATFERFGAAFERERARGFSPGAGVLTPREREVLRLVAEGLADKEMAVRLRLSEHTVHRHVSNILTKLDLPSRTAAVAWAMRQGLL